MSRLYKKLQKLINDQPEADKKFIRKAFLFAKKVHYGQKRKTGEDYITHPLNISIMLAERKFDIDTIAAGILHDVIEDTPAKYDELVNNFNQNVADIVLGVTKISNIKNKEERLNFLSDDQFVCMIDNYRKFLLATAKDVRVIIVKIFERIHNLETIDWLKEEKKEFYSKESIEIYAQIAGKIGLSEAKIKLENLSFKYAYPKKYDNFIKIKNNISFLDSSFTQKTIKKIKQLLNKNDLKFFNISGRIKHDYSLYQKLQRESVANVNSIYDLYAFRIITFSVSDCYKALGLIHSVFDPVPGRIFDMIARPKENGYQSIHTTVKNEQGNVFEIQIRTKAMHDIAEYGPAAHWHYKDLFNFKNQRLINKSNLEWQEEFKILLLENNHKKSLQSLKNNIFSEIIFVFTPMGEIIKLPVGATSIDFAFLIHTNIGLHCNGVKINNKMMPISTKLKNGDSVEIATSNKAKPSIDWLNFTKTASAKQKIRQFLRDANRVNLIQQGKDYLNSYIEQFNLPILDQKIIELRINQSRLPYNKLNDALVALAEKDLPKVSFLKILYPSFNNTQKIKLTNFHEKSSLDSLAGIVHLYAGCCKPKQTDNLVGYVTKNHVIKVHNKNCRFIKKADNRRLFDI